MFVNKQILTVMNKKVPGDDATYTRVIIYMVAVNSFHTRETLSHYETTFP